jgi:hypothetical protein
LIEEEEEEEEEEEYPVLWYRVLSGDSFISLRFFLQVCLAVALDRRLI